MRLSGIGLERGQVEGGEVALLEAVGVPVLLKAEDQMALHQALDRTLQRERQLHRALVGHEVGLALEKAGRAIDHRRLGLAVGVAQDVARDRDILDRAAEQFRGLRQGRATLPGLQHERVAGPGHRPCAPVAGDEQGILVEPADVLLALRGLEAAGDEGLRHGVELAIDDRVLAAVRQRDQAVPVLGGQAAGALVDPVLAFGLRQGVDVQNRLPDRLGGAVAVQRGLAPDAAHMGRVLPEVAQLAVAGKADAGDAVPGLQDGQRLGAHAGIAGIRLQGRQRGGVLRPRPGHGPVTLDLLHPGVGVLRGWRRNGRRGESGQGGQTHCGG